MLLQRSTTYNQTKDKQNSIGIDVITVGARDFILLKCPWGLF